MEWWERGARRSVAPAARTYDRRIVGRETRERKLLPRRLFRLPLGAYVVGEGLRMWRCGRRVNHGTGGGLVAER